MVDPGGSDALATALRRSSGSAMASRQLVEALHEGLAAGGWTDVRPPYGFVLLAARERPLTAGEVTELLGTTKQATSQLLEAMEAEGLVARIPDPDDARVKRVVLTDRGRELLATVERIYGELERDWALAIGADRVEATRDSLRDVVLALHGGRLPPLRPVW